MKPRVRWAAGWLLFMAVWPLFSQIDPERRRLLHLGYNLPLEGSGPIAAYGFVYLNQPHFLRTNLTLRAAIAPIYLDTELGFGQLLGERTDLALGLAGGGYAHTYSEVRDGKYLRDESFIGHGAEISSSIYHLFNPGRLIPLNGVLRGSLRRLFYDEDAETDDAFRPPKDHFSFDLRAGLRWAGQEPTLTAPLGMEVSVWYEGEFRTHSGRYGFGGDREVESISHLFWTRALLRYTFESFRQSLEGSLTAGTSINADRFSAYRLGGVLPFAAEFPLNLPGYYFQELSASQFALLNAQYAFPLEPRGNFQGTLYAGTGWVDYLEGLEQPGNWHSGAGAGITYRSPKGAWFVSLIYAHGFDARRDHGRGANQVGLIFQYDFEATAKWFNPAISPYRSRGAERIFRR